MSNYGHSVLISLWVQKKRGTVFTVKEAVEARQTNKRTAHAEA